MAQEATARLLLNRWRGIYDAQLGSAFFLASILLLYHCYNFQSVSSTMAPNDHIVQLPTTPNIDPDQVNPNGIAQEWLSALQSHLAGSNPTTLSELFHDDSWWRDMLVLQWDFHTVKGLTKIESFIAKNQPRVQLGAFGLGARDGRGATPNIETPVAGMTWLSALFSFECQFGSGSGVVYLTQECEGARWKAYSVYVALQELDRCRERLGLMRPEGTSGFGDTTWAERRTMEVEFQDNDGPAVFIIGAGII